MATFWEIAARSVNNLFSLYFVYLLYLFISRFSGFKSGICLLIAPVPVHCFSITYITRIKRTVLISLQMKMSAPVVPRVVADSVQIQSAVSLVIALEPGMKETHVKLVNTVEAHDYTFTLNSDRIEFAFNINKLNS